MEIRRKRARRSRKTVSNFGDRAESRNDLAGAFRNERRLITRERSRKPDASRTKEISLTALIFSRGNFYLASKEGTIGDGRFEGGVDRWKERWERKRASTITISLFPVLEERESAQLGARNVFSFPPAPLSHRYIRVRTRLNEGPQ